MSIEMMRSRFATEIAGPKMKKAKTLKKSKTGKTKSIARYLLISVLFLLFATNALGHTFYIQSSRYHVNEGKKTPLFFCYGHHVPVDDGLRADKLKSIQVHSPSGNIKEIDIRRETSLHSYMISYDEPGTYILSAQTNPGYYTVYIDKKGRERHTIKPKSAVLDKADKILKSLYSNQYAKSYVVCEKASPDFPSRIGLPLELVPLNDISTLKPGDNLELSVYYMGKPYTGKGTLDATADGFSTESENNFFEKKSVSGSRMTLPVPEGGRWFVRYSIKIDAPETERQHCNKMKHTATLVFQVEKKGIPAKL